MSKQFKTAIKNITGFVKKDKQSVRGFLFATISLTLVIAMMTTMSFSWFTIKRSTLTAGTPDLFKLDCGKGLRVNDSGSSELSFQQTNNYLIPASSVDGRNLYFPTDGSDFSNTTEYMTFRASNAGDKNKNYIQIDFTLTAQQNHTALYIDDAKTSIKVKPTNTNEDYSQSQAASLRSALWCSTEEGGVPNTPIVFNPTDNTVFTAAVADVDRSSGAYISSGRQVAHSFSEYSFGGTPVATLSKNVVTHFSYIIWLEGTDPKCTDRIISKDIEIKLAFTTSWDRTQTIRFKDSTSGNAIKTKLTSDHYTLTLRYKDTNGDNSTTDFMMYPLYSSDIDPDNKTWTCNIPGDMRNEITFILRPSSNSVSDNKTYIFCKNSRAPSGTDSDSALYYTYDRGPNRLYTAETLDATNTNLCAGYWVAIGDSDGAGHDSGNLDGDDF